MMDRERADGDFHCASGGDQVTHRALGRADRQLIDMLAEHRMRCDTLAAVVHRCRRTVRVEIVDVGGNGAGVRDCCAHRLDWTVAVGRRVSDPIARQRIAVAGKLGVDAGAAPARRFPFLQHDKARALAQQKAVAREVERTARAFGRFVVGRQCGEKTEAGNSDRADHRVEAAGQRVVRGAAADQLERSTERLPARRA